MLSHVYFLEPQIRMPADTDANEKDRGSLHVAYPALLTTHRREAHNHLPIAMINQKTCQPAEVPPGQFMVFDKETLKKATEAGYNAAIISNGRLWRLAYRKGKPIPGHHWHPEARLVRYDNGPVAKETMGTPAGKNAESGDNTDHAARPQPPSIARRSASATAEPAKGHGQHRTGRN